MQPSRALRARRRQRLTEERCLVELDALRDGLHAESARCRRESRRRRGADPEHLCCRRPENQMRISPLEARAIVSAFQTDPDLRARLPGVLERLAAEIPRLEDNGERQSFDCPLLEAHRCLVHGVAKPIGCLAWNRGKSYTKTAWRAFESRDRLNDSLYGRGWQLRAIPLWLKRVFRRHLRQRASREAGKRRSLATRRERNNQPP